VIIDFALQLLPADSQQIGGPALVVARSLKRSHDMIALELV
jgi:hypothetical protein